MTPRQAKKLLKYTVVKDTTTGRLGVVQEIMHAGFTVAWAFGNTTYVQFGTAGSISIY